MNTGKHARDHEACAPIHSFAVRVIPVYQFQRMNRRQRLSGKWYPSHTYDIGRLIAVRDPSRKRY